MTNEHMKAELAGIIGEAQQQLRVIAEIQRDRAELTGTASVRKNRVTVSVNADGTVIETKFGAGIEDLSYSEIARAVTEAAQQASKNLAQRHRELTAPLRERRARLPKLTDLIEDMPDVRLPTAPEPSLAPPDSPERTAAYGADEFRFADAETYPVEPERRVTDSSW
ncbi:YbaB/EbfC family nucleoid-associated protein [Nocardia aobensis]|uniref:YbaB/EbfC family nucleoid-associated protein n=1 Tax=Nocardia aobensis TaxID=257277 RepID=UPI00031C6AEB|nr:YbaB/EbfC family nucleoid-associated protein [Nocardia aobensis]